MGAGPTRRTVWGGRTVCNGDSGGPLIKFPSSEYSGWEVQVGVISASHGCPSPMNAPSLATRLKYFVPWIKSIAKNVTICQFFWM